MASRRHFNALQLNPADKVLRTWLLDTQNLDVHLRLQGQLRQEVVEGAAPTLLIYELEPCITVGREGSTTHINWEDLKGQGYGLSVRLVNRGGGCWLHLPGQLVISLLFPLTRLGLSLPHFLAELQAVLANLVGLKGIQPVETQPFRSTLVNSRPIGCVGLAVRSWVTSHGAILNVSPELEPFRQVRTGASELPMTSLQRECGRTVRMAQVRERLVDLMVCRFGFANAVLFMEHPLLGGRRRSRALFTPR